ncbi:MAG: hypothetical protein AB8G86_26845 [Saprospiraceae bacterium]
MKKQKIIDFIGIGAQKSGTSWLVSNLRKIPEFDMPPKKEFHYFNRHPKYPSPDNLSRGTSNVGTESTVKKIAKTGLINLELPQVSKKTETRIH